MSNYNNPTMSGIGFNFTTGGYSAPGMDELEIRFGFRPSYQQTADLQAAINVLGLYQDSTYTYLKSCPTYIVGYGSGGIQIIKAPCIYGGIRDLGAYIHGNPEHADLNAYIDAKLPGADVGAYIKGMAADSADIIGDLKGVFEDTMDLEASITGQLFRSTEDLNAYLQSVPPADLSGYLNVISTSDLSANINGNLLTGFADLGAGFSKVFDRGFADLSAYIEGYQIHYEGETDLPANINSIDYTDLTGLIIGWEHKDLAASLKAIPPSDLSAYIRGFAIKDLPASISGEFGPHDLRGYLNAVPSVNLPAYLLGFSGYGVSRDLAAIVAGYFTSDLSAFINSTVPIDLPANLNATGKVGDLPASIYPMVIHLRKVLSVSLLEHTNLHAVINAGCVGSMAHDLSAYLYPLMKRDLSANIIGWKDGVADGVNDLAAYVNASDHLATDYIPVYMYPSSKHTLLKLSFDKDTFYATFDTLNIKFNSFYGSNLAATITGVPQGVDLSANLTVVQQIPYRQAPRHMRIKNREVVLNLTRFEPQWRRVAELFFDDYGSGSPFHYFYVEGGNKVYKIDRSKHWVIRAVGYTRAKEGYNVTRQKIWKKYIFNMSNYSSVDEAVRDLIDRVTFLRREHLSAYINGVLPPHKDLSATMTTTTYNHWVGHLRAAVKTIQRGPQDLTSEINSVLFSGDTSLGATITGAGIYTPATGDSADFEFTSTDAGYTPPADDASDYTFDF